MSQDLSDCESSQPYRPQQCRGFDQLQHRAAQPAQDRAIVPNNARAVPPHQEYAPQETAHHALPRCNKRDTWCDLHAAALSFLYLLRGNTGVDAWHHLFRTKCWCKKPDPRSLFAGVATAAQQDRRTIVRCANWSAPPQLRTVPLAFAVADVAHAAALLHPAGTRWHASPERNAPQLLLLVELRARFWRGEPGFQSPPPPNSHGVLKPWGCGVNNDGADYRITPRPTNRAQM